METSDIIRLGLKKQGEVLMTELKRMREKNKYNFAWEMAQVGAQINYSYWGMPESKEYSSQEIVLAFHNLGIDFIAAKGRLWYQFWLNDFDVKFINALKQICPDGNKRPHLPTTTCDEDVRKCLTN